jgi:Tfp pilus assembly protein PilF
LTARSHERLGHDNEARRHFELGMEVSHANPELAYEFAKFLQERGDQQQARGLLERAEYSPELPQTPYYESVIRLEMAKFYEQDGRADSARAEYARCLARASRGSDVTKAASEGLRRLRGR